MGRKGRSYMNIIVCIKQVPEIGLIKIDDSNHKVVYPQGAGMTNPFDDYAVEEALRIKEKTGGKITALSLGNKNSEAALRNCLALGVDEAVLLQVADVNLIDSYTAAQILSLGIRKIGDYDLVLCGKQAVDGDSSLIPPSLAEWLGLPQVTFVKKFESLDQNGAAVKRMTEEGHDLIEISLPAVVSVVKEINEPRLPSLKGKMRAKSAPVTVWGKAELGLEEEIVSGEGSLTKMSSFASPPQRPRGDLLEGESASELVGRLVEKLKEAQVI
jgi:electron transfer flavoprotein beta subunit